MALFQRENLDMQWLIGQLEHVDIEAAFTRNGSGNLNRAQCLKALNTVRRNTTPTLRYLDALAWLDLDAETRHAVNEVRRRTLVTRSVALSSAMRVIIAPSTEELRKIADNILSYYHELRTDAEVLCMLQRPDLVEALHCAF